MHRSRSSILLLTMLVLASGCGADRKDEEPRLDAGKAEGAISEGVKEQLDVDLRIQCPRDEPQRKGRTFTCTGSGGDSEEIPIKVRQTDGNGKISWTAKVMATTQIEESVAAEIRRERDLAVSLDCPDAVLLEVGHEFDCEVTTPEGQRDRIVVTVADDEGGVTWAVPARGDRAPATGESSEERGAVSGEANVG